MYLRIYTRFTKSQQIVYRIRVHFGLSANINQKKFEESNIGFMDPRSYID